MFQNIKKFDLFLIGITLLNLVQAFFTPIIQDEAYYWMFSNHLDWGYFDHPPMVALLIKLGSLIVPDALGIRLLTVVFSALLIKVIWSLIPKENKTHKHTELIFFGILLAIPIFNMFSFISTPDVALLLFSSLYLAAILKLETKANFLNILFVATSAALLIYSKYHGGVIILLSILFKFHLLKKKGIYIAGLLAIIIVFPHFYWQYNNHFITFDYHLFQRTDGGFRIKNVLNYILSTVGILNPALFVLLVMQLIKSKTQLTKHTLFFKQLFIGLIAFFFMYSFRGRIEAHWVALALAPMLILLHTYIVNSTKLIKNLKYIGGITIGLIVLARIAIVLPLPIKSEFHSEKKAYFKAISKIANGRKVVFANSYQRASKHTFYTGEASYSLDNIFYYRKSQYDLWNYENLHNEKVLFIGVFPDKFFKKIKIPTGESILVKEIDKFPMFGNLKATINSPISEISDIQKKKIEISIHNPYSYDIDIQRADMPYRMYVFYEVLGKKDTFINFPLHIKSIENLKANSTTQLTLDCKKRQMPNGKYRVFIGMKAGFLVPQRISRKIPITINN